MRRTGWIAAGLFVVAGVTWLTLRALPVDRDEAEPEAAVDGAFEASVKEPQRARAGEQADAMWLARADAPALSERGAQQRLTERFEAEARDDGAERVESAVHDALARGAVAPELFKSVLCRKTVCKLVVRMAPERMPGYQRALSALANAGFSADANAAPALDERGEREVDLYLRHSGSPASQP